MPRPDSPLWIDRAAAILDPAASAVEYPARLVLEVYGHARECYPEECCGLLIGPSNGPPTRIVRCTNLQSQRHARGESELDARHAFWIDQTQLLVAQREADERGEQIRAVYHSHVDTEAYLSHTDLAGAIGPDGVPMYPGCDQLVVSVHSMQEGGIRGVVCFVWDAAAGRFVGHPLEQT